MPSPHRRSRWRRRLSVAGAFVVLAAAGLLALVLIGQRYNANPGLRSRQASGATGMEIYRINCAGCHGAAGEGGLLDIKGPAFAAGGPLAGLTFAQRVAKTSRGRPLAGMPRWGLKISDADIRKVAAYTQILSGEPPEPGVRGVR